MIKFSSSLIWSCFAIFNPFFQYWMPFLARNVARIQWFFLCQARDWHTNLPPFHDARPDHVPVENSSCFFPRELLSFVCPRRIWRVEFWNMTRDKFSSNRKTYLIWEVWRYMWGSRADFCALTLGPCPSSWIKGHLTRKLAQTGTAISLCILISQLPKILFSKRVSVTSFDNTKKKINVHCLSTLQGNWHPSLVANKTGP